jgi:hypothetical protein
MAKPKDETPPASFEQWLAKLKEAGFTVQAQDGGRVRISKHGCAAVLEPSPSREPGFAVRPGLLVRAVPPCGMRERTNDLRPEQETHEAIAHLLDRGFQKFWQEGERQIPALSAQLYALHRFDQDLRAVMGLTALYNEALGTVSSRYIYDRLEGREKPKRHQAF